ncbi:MAG: chemotaxis protein CheW [Caulobacteraceae bacterium]|nr:chemotaxis protein CheW [Caulobacteraceae bacterium]
MAEAREGLEALDSKLVAFEREPDDPALLGDIFRLIHSIKGTSGFLGLMRLQAVAHAAENVLGGFRDGSLAVSPARVTPVLEAIDVIRGIVDALEAGGVEPAGDDAGLIARLDEAFRGASDGDETDVLAEPEAPLIQRLGGDAAIDAAVEMAMGDDAWSSDEGVTRRSNIRDMLTDRARAGAPGCLSFDSWSLPGAEASDLAGRIGRSLVALDAEVEAVEALLRPASEEPAYVEVEPESEPEPLSVPASAAAEPATAAVAGAPVAAEATAANQTIRVSVDVLENLMTTVSELVLIRNQLLQVLRTQPDTPFAGPLHRLNQVTSELQEGVMTTRMQPISVAWAKLPRVVRDLAADLGKRIELVMSGQETELDRQVLELIRDPLTHMIRNAADHGLEMPEARRAAGKPETGRISLHARHEGGAIVIELADDGKGLPAARIRAKAVEAGVVSAAQAATMTDAEARQLIFLPGFSTAEAVTAVSGRGVGMDVVRTNIEKIGGAIELSSTEGVGTRFTIRIPLTLSIVSAIIVETAGERFALPQAGIVELVSAGSGDSRRVETVNGARVLRLRDRLLPLVSLHAMLGLPGEEEDRPDSCIVVARVGSFVFGVLVDRVFDTEEIVVKPVASILRHIRLYSGATILGDGSVIMILDFKGMSIEAGAGHLMASGEDVVAVEEEAAVEQRPMLLFRAGDAGLKAVALDEVDRIEELHPSALEFADGRALVQYRGVLMPVVDHEGRPISAEDARRTPLLVFSREERSLGIHIDEIVDVVEATPVPATEGGRPGSAGSMIVAGAAAELLDLSWYWMRAFGTALAGSRTAPSVEAPAAATTASAPFLTPASSGPPHRLLIIDRSPFSQLLLRPLLAQAGYAVEVCDGPEAALARHDAGEKFDLIVADTTPAGDEARRLAGALRRASDWHRTPLLGLGAHDLADPARTGEFAEEFDKDAMLDDVRQTLAGAA